MRNGLQQQPAEAPTVQTINYGDGGFDCVGGVLGPKVPRNANDRRRKSAVGVEQAGADRDMMLGVGVQQAVEQRTGQVRHGRKEPQIPRAAR